MHARCTCTHIAKHTYDESERERGRERERKRWSEREGQMLFSDELRLNGDIWPLTDWTKFTMQWFIRFSECFGKHFIIVVGKADRISWTFDGVFHVQLITFRNSSTVVMGKTIGHITYRRDSALLHQFSLYIHIYMLGYIQLDWLNVGLLLCVAFIPKCVVIKYFCSV